ncbi:MAG: hypothetical protein PHT59_07960 [Candidatus Omnitrophica bacterium]|nr:hypothetical protein [Candidatus Omnitrophota bacterium]
MTPNVPQFPPPPVNSLNVLINRIDEQRQRAAKDAAEAMQRRLEREEAERQAQEEKK